MIEITYKNNHGLVEIFGMTDDPTNPDYAYEDATRIGLYVQDKRIDGVLRTSSLPMSPRMARQVADGLLQWADQIERSSDGNT